MSTDTTRLRYSSQDFKLRCELADARQFRVADVNGSGADTGAAAADTGGVVPTHAAFDQISDVGTIRGSIAEGGWSCALTVPQVLADFADFFGCDLWLQSWYGGVPGVVGAAGIADQARIFRGWMTDAKVERRFLGTTSTFTMRSSSHFLSSSSLTRGIDWASGLPHGAPGTSNALIDHLLRYHTNYAGRGRDIGIYLPNHSIDAFSVNEGSILSMVQQLADNFAGIGQVFSRREDDLFVGASPSILGALHPNLASPIIEFTQDLLLSIEVPEFTNYQCAQVTVEAQHSDQTAYAARYYGATGVGSRVKYSIRTDHNAMADFLAERLFAYANRRYRDVKLTMGLNVAVDLGDVITITMDLPQRGIHWSSKLFHVLAVEYRPDLSRRTWQTVLTCEEIV